mmetsp:Transcript_54473/g.151819  ORF Transcript_54473/g.151819 Transcript_54473/m.151819 type:complete len:422 (-) Transcript_54473:23-1288(-)
MAQCLAQAQPNHPIGLRCDFMSVVGMRPHARRLELVLCLLAVVPGTQGVGLRQQPAVSAPGGAVEPRVAADANVAVEPPPSAAAVIEPPPGVVIMPPPGAPTDTRGPGDDLRANGTCDASALQAANLAWLQGRIDEMNTNPCADLEEVMYEQMDFVDLQRSRDRFGSYATNGCKIPQLPGMLYLGQGHTGSTTLAMQLDAHPELSYGALKEHHWGEQVFSGNGHLNDYMRQFSVPCSTKVSMDFSAGEYLDGHHGDHWQRWSSNEELLPWHHGNVSARVDPQIVREVLGPDTKLVVMMRDPVDFLDSLPPRWAKKVKHVRGDCYALGVSKWLEVFPKENMLFISAEEYFVNSQTVLDRIFKFLGVSPWTYPGETPNSGRRRHTHNLDADERRAYHSLPANKKCKKHLERITGLTFNWPGSE